MTDDPQDASRRSSGKDPHQTLPETPGTSARPDSSARNVARLMSSLELAVTCSDRAEGERRLAALVDTGTPIPVFIDEIIPEVARRLGAAWCEDRSSFVEVTIGTTRLQGWLRELERQMKPSLDLTSDGHSVLLIVPDSSSHYLGAMVAMSQFRRLGATVRLLLGEPMDVIHDTLRRTRFDLVAISASSCDRLENLRSLVNMVRTGVAPVPKVAIGGTIMVTSDNAAERVGADLVTHDPKEALALCGRSIVTHDGPPTRTTKTQAASGQPVPAR